MRFFIPVGLFLLVHLKAHSQIDNKIFDDTLLVIKPKELALHWDNLGFLSNTEFFGPMALGSTLFGFQSLPRLQYQISPKTSLTVGGFFWKDFGNEAFSQISPFVRMHYRSGGFAINLGNLQGCLQHKLIEPIFDYRRLIFSRIENGLQFLFKNKRFHWDTWIDWRKMIYPNSAFQEEFHQGIVLKYDLYQSQRAALSLHAQNFALHRGGQIQDTSLRGAAFTALNTALGLQFETPKTHIETWLLRHQTQNNQGTALLVNTTLKTRFLILTASYFLGNKYETLTGMPLYSSRSQYQERFMAQREILFLRLIKEFELDESNRLAVRVIPYFDTKLGLFEYSYELYWRMVIGAKIKSF